MIERLMGVLSLGATSLETYPFKIRVESVFSFLLLLLIVAITRPPADSPSGMK